MIVQISEAGDQITAMSVNAQRVRGSFDLIRRSDLDNLPVFHDHRLAGEDKLAIHRYDIDINERDSLVFVVSRQLLRLSRAESVGLRCSRLIRWHREIE